MVKLGIFCLLLLMVAQPACAASFDCAKASTKIEKMICSDMELSKLDESLHTKYDSVLSESSNDLSFQSLQKSKYSSWLKKRNHCPDEACLKYGYRQHISYLDNPNPKAEFGFDCKKANSPFEKHACDPEVNRWRLAWADNELNTVYRDALAKHFDPELLRKEQRVWLKARDRCVKDIHCNVENLYDDRIYNLRYDTVYPPQTQEDKNNARLLSMGSPAGNNFYIDRVGYGLVICEAMVRWLNHTVPEGKIPYDSSPLPQLPGLEEPEWIELNVQQHKDLFVKLLTANRTNAPKDKLQAEIRHALSGHYHLWMIKEDVTGMAEQETLVTFSIKANLEKINDSEWKVPPFLSNDNLSDIDLPKSKATISVYGMGMKMFKGSPYFIGGGGTGVYVRDKVSICSIKNYRP